MLFAEIITIGDEILIGQVVDTNSAWLGKILNKNGISVRQITSIRDNKEELKSALDYAAKRADLIILTGGLGPTKDDLTKHTLCEYFQSKLIRHLPSLEIITKIFERYNRPLLPVNICQADVPDNCKVMINEQGTAPGMWFEKEGIVYVSMPGVPYEMYYMFEDKVLPAIQEHFNLPFIVHKTIITAGIGESFLAELIADVEDELPSNIKLAYLPRLGQVRLRLSAYGENEINLHEELKKYIIKISNLIEEHIISFEDITLEEAVINELFIQGKTLSTAESCTGGYIAHLLTSIPGSSKSYMGGTVSYSNDLKTAQLGVNPVTIAEFGSVSKQVAIEMAQGALQNFKTDYAVSCTGIAGPDGGSDEKPVGTVWIAIATLEGTIAKKFNFGNKRIQNIERTAMAALTILFKKIKGRWRD